MANPFEVRKQIEVQASPDVIWDAITTGEGMDGWFVGTGNEVERRLGGTVRLAFGGEIGVSTVTTWEPPRHFAHRGEVAPDGSLHAMEYVIEARDGGRTVVRLVHSGFLGDDWEAEYEALNEGDFMYLHLMAQYLAHFRGRRAAVVAAYQPVTGDGQAAVDALRAALGVTAETAEGDPLRLTVDGVAPIEGVVDFVSPRIVGIRTDDALYRFLYAPMGVVYAGHHIYRDDLDKGAAQEAWQAWLAARFAEKAA